MVHKQYCFLVCGRLTGFCVSCFWHCHCNSMCVSTMLLWLALFFQDVNAFCSHIRIILFFKICLNICHYIFCTYMYQAYHLIGWPTFLLLLEKEKHLKIWKCWSFSNFQPLLGADIKQDFTDLSGTDDSVWWKKKWLFYPLLYYFLP